MPSSNRTLSPRDLATAVGVSESSIKRWIDAGEMAAARTSGGHRRVSQREAVRFIRDRGLTVALPAALGLNGILSAQSLTDAPTAEALIEALTAEDAVHAEGMLLAAYLNGASLPALFDGPVREAVHHLGTLWHDGDVGIVFEHRAVDLLVRAVNRIRALQPVPAADAPVAVGGAVAGDPYLLPSLMAAAVLAERGFRVTNLGPDTPHSGLTEACRRLDPDLLWLSVSVSTENLGATLRALAAAITPKLLALGGRGLEPTDLPGIEGVHVLQTMDELDLFVEKHMNGLGA